MRLPLTLTTAAAALALASSPSAAWAGSGPHFDHDLPPPPSAMMDDDAPPPHLGYEDPHGAGWAQEPPQLDGARMEHCAAHHGAGPMGCHGHPAPHGYGHGYMGYGVPMMMVPVLRNRPCPERVVEEWVEEPVHVRRRYIAPRRHVVPDKRVRVMPDKRLPMDKRIRY